MRVDKFWFRQFIKSGTRTEINVHRRMTPNYEFKGHF